MREEVGMAETVEGRALPIQVATSEVARDVARRAAALRESAQAIADNATDHRAVEDSLKSAEGNDSNLASMKSSLTSESMGHRLGVCRYVLMTQGMAKLVDLVTGYVATFVGALYPEHPYVWSEDELESAKAEAAFAVAATRAMTCGALAVPDELAKLQSATLALNDLLRVATYQGQAMELQARISASQLELVAQQAEVLNRFDEQNKKMGCMNKLVSVCTIAAAVIAAIQVAPLVWQFICFVFQGVAGLIAAL